MFTLTTIELTHLAQLAQNPKPFFILVHQPTVTISNNQIAYINSNLDSLKVPIYILEFEPVRSELLEVFNAHNVNFAHVGFPLFLLFYKEQTFYCEAGALTLAGLNELAELAVEHYNRQSKII
jgi:hypothetical protein